MTGCFTQKAAPPGRRQYSAFDMLGTYDFEGLETRFGWTAGAGIEWALWNDWSLRLEYDYYGFGTRSVTFIDNVSATVGPLDIKQNIQIVKLGPNFHIFARIGGTRAVVRNNGRLAIRILGP